MNVYNVIFVIVRQEVCQVQKLQLENQRKRYNTKMYLCNGLQRGCIMSLLAERLVRLAVKIGPRSKRYFCQLLLYEIIMVDELVESTGKLYLFN